VPWDGEIWTSPTKPWSQCSDVRRAALRKAWNSGNLRYKFDPNQQEIYDAIRASHGTTEASINRYFGLDVSRQVGKDFIMGVLSVETCMRNRNRCSVVYAAPTRDEVKKLLVPTLEGIFDDCPPDLLPQEISNGTFTKSADELRWRWGAKIVLVGVDVQPDRLRGPATKVFMFTECAFVGDMVDLMESVLLPQLLTHPDGFGVLGSTPPKTPGHPWTVKYLPRAQERGMYWKSIITDCPRFTGPQVRAMMEELGAPTNIAVMADGLRTIWDADQRQQVIDAIVAELLRAGATRCARELFCVHVVETALAAVPEMQRMRPRITIQGRITRPAFCDTYTVMDPGFSHATGALFLYVDFREAKIVIEGDFARQGQNTRAIARLIYAREWQLWGYKPTKPEWMTDEAWEIELELVQAEFYNDAGRPPEKPVVSHHETLGVVSGPRARISDVEPRLIADLIKEHGLQFRAAKKDGVETSINRFRLAIQGRGDGDAWRPRIQIHERCVNAMTHFEHALWNKQRTKLANAPDGGHYDCLPAGVYAVRGVDWQHNPWPVGQQAPHVDTTWDIAREQQKGKTVAPERYRDLASAWNNGRWRR